jgi:exodeoxyribonuclease-3
MKISTFNINSIRTRLPILKDFILKHSPDLLLCQEVKCEEKDFPFLELNYLQDLNYTFHYKLQKAYNGVLTLSKLKSELIHTSLPNFKDESARYLEIKLLENNIHIINVYIPNGNPIADSSKYQYKLAFLQNLYNHLLTLSQQKINYIIAGDFNIIPTKNDLYSEASFLNDALYQKEVKDLYFKMLNLPLVDSLNIFSNDKTYTWWDYRNNSLEKNQGVRIDHILTSPNLANYLNSAEVIKEPRYQEKPSDHTPVIAMFNKISLTNIQ